MSCPTTDAVSSEKISGKFMGRIISSTPCPKEANRTIITFLIPPADVLTIIRDFCMLGIDILQNHWGKYKFSLDSPTFEKIQDKKDFWFILTKVPGEIGSEITIL
jgi:hypothetical protein